MISAQAIGRLKASVELQSIEVDATDNDAVINLCDEIDELRRWLQMIRERIARRAYDARYNVSSQGQTL